MKCCIVSTLYPPNIVGGAEKVTAKLAAGLVRAGHNVTVITLHGHAETKIEYVEGVKVYYLPIDNIYWPFSSAIKPHALKRFFWHCMDMWNFKAAARVGKILDEEKPDVVNSNNLTGFSVAVWAEAKKRGIKIIHTLHDYALLCPRGTLYKNIHTCKAGCGFCRAMSKPKHLASQLVDHVVGVSKFVVDKHKQYHYFANARQSVIHNICDLPEPLEKRRGESGHPFSFGFIGRVEEEKGIEVLLQATKQLPDSGWCLRIAGRGREDYVERLKVQYPHSNIQWLGFIKPDDFYKQIDVLIVPSLWPEPLPGVIAEAAAHQIPLVISDIGGMPEFLQLGITGIAIPAGDVQRLASEMNDAMAGRGVMALPLNKGHAWKKELSEDKVVQHYLTCYQSRRE